MRITSQHREEEDLSIGIMQIGHMSFPLGSAVLECNYFPLEIGVRLTNVLAIKIKAGYVIDVYRICLNPLNFVLLIIHYLKQAIDRGSVSARLFSKTMLRVTGSMSVGPGTSRKGKFPGLPWA